MTIFACKITKFSEILLLFMKKMFYDACFFNSFLCLNTN